MPNSTPEFDPQEAELYAALGKPEQSCPPFRLLLAAGQDTLPRELDERIQQHKQHCALCRGLISDVAGMPDVPASPAQLRRIASSLPSHPPSQSSGAWHPRLLYAVAAMLLLSQTTWAFLHRRSAVKETQRAQTSASAPAVKMASVNMPLTPLAPPDSSATDLLTRGGATTSNPSTEELLPAFIAYNRGDYLSAARLFKPLVAAYPRGDVAPLYLGVSQLMLHQDDAAYATFRATEPIVSRSRAGALQWYTGVAVQSTHPEEARAILAALCAEKNSTYATQSCALVSSANQ